MSASIEDKVKTSERISQEYRREQTSYKVISGNIKNGTAKCESEIQHAHRINKLANEKWVSVESIVQWFQEREWRGISSDALEALQEALGIVER